MSIFFFSKKHSLKKISQTKLSKTKFDVKIVLKQSVQIWSLITLTGNPNLSNIIKPILLGFVKKTPSNKYKTIIFLIRVED